MEKLTNQTIYKCSYCSKVSKGAAAIRCHEFYCKNNPNTLYLCVTCKHCIVDADFAEEYSACYKCGYYSQKYGDCNKPTPCEENRREITTFTCGIDKAQMYSPRSIQRSSFKQNILNRCDRPMKSIAEGCEHYINVYNTDEHDSCLKGMGLL